MEDDTACDPGVVGRCGFYNIADEADDCGVGWLIKISNVRVATIHSQGILDKVIGTDAEEIHMWRELVREYGG